MTATIATPKSAPDTEQDSLLNARGHLETIASQHKAFLFCQGELEGRDLDKEAKACLREHGFPGDNLDCVREGIEESAREAALSVEVRSGWHVYGETLEIEEMKILLSTGGPALQILCSIDEGQPSRPRLQHQDWGKPWTDMLILDQEEREALDWFVNLFSFS